MRLAVIANPAAGGQKGKKQLPVIQERFKTEGLDYDLFVSKDQVDLEKICLNLDIDQYDALIAAGGDGTNFRILNSLLKTFPATALPPLGILPVGSGNSFARDLNIETLDHALSAIRNGHAKPVDLISFSNGDQKTYFVNLMGLGFVTDVARTASRFKYLRDFSYIIGVLHQVITLSFHHLQLEIDGKYYQGENCFVEFCNSRYTGGSMLMAPDAQIDDGYMDIVIAGRLSRTSLLVTLPKIFKGTHLQNPEVTCIKAKKATIKTDPPKILLPDGEILGITPVTVEVHPRCMKYLVCL